MRRSTPIQEAVKQAAIADRLLVTKTDLAAADELERLFSRLSALNPTATVILSREGDAPAAALIGVGLEARRGGPTEIVDWFERAARATERPRFRAEAHDAVRDTTCGDPRCADPRHGLRHGEDISTFSIIIDDPVEWGAFRRWLEYLAMLKGEDLLRFKGLIHIAERPDTPIVVHGVQHVFHPPRELAAWPSADRRTRLVFITRGISRSLIENTLIEIRRDRRRADAQAGGLMLEIMDLGIKMEGATMSLKTAFLLAGGLSATIWSGSAFAAGPTCPDGPIKLGAISTITGPADFSEVPKATKAMYDAVNAAGGINGCKIDYEIADDKADPAGRRPGGARLHRQQGSGGDGRRREPARMRRQRRQPTSAPEDLVGAGLGVDAGLLQLAQHRAGQCRPLHARPPRWAYSPPTR